MGLIANDNQIIHTAFGSVLCCILTQIRLIGLCVLSKIVPSKHDHQSGLRVLASMCIIKCHVRKHGKVARENDSERTGDLKHLDSQVLAVNLRVPGLI